MKKIVMTKIDLILALDQVENISKLIAGNEYEHFFVSRLVPIQIELQRQLTNLNVSTTIKE
jgi:hypothetical protein